MTHIDNSEGMSPEQIKEVFINSINKVSQRLDAQAGYDKTILAKIQYCSDATLGQYKILYQNGYYTAYARDTSKKYSEGASVYVTVPGNDFKQRLFIQDLAGNDSSQRTYLTTLEGDQQYAVIGKDFISSIPRPDDLSMSTHWDMPDGRDVVYYNFNGGLDYPNKLSVISLGEMQNAVTNSDGFIRLGAQFKTDIMENRKNQGNYGIRFNLAFDTVDPVTQEVNGEEIVTYTLDTFVMDGAPFDFNEFAERYVYFKIDKERFKRVDSIVGFVKNFAESSVTPPPLDIFVRNISVQAAKKVYDITDNNDYVVVVTMPDGLTFDFNTTDSSKLRAEGQLKYMGNPVSDQQNVKYYWAKKNDTIDKTSNKYNEIFGVGWQSLNSGTLTSTSSNTPSKETLENYAISMEDYNYTGKVEWDSNKAILIPRSLCPGRTTIIKCCAVYENQRYYSVDIEITYIGGWYLLGSLENSTGVDTNEFYSGRGYATITTGVFHTTISNSGDSARYASTIEQPADIHEQNSFTYKWQIENNGVTYNIPMESSSQLYLPQPYWSTTNQEIPNLKDDETTSLSESNQYLTALGDLYQTDADLLRYCLQRYNYYNDFCNQNSSSEYYNNAKAKLDDIKTGWQTYIDSCYTQNYTNEIGLYITGPSQVMGEYPSLNEAQLRSMYVQNQDPKPYAEITSKTKQYYSGTPFTDSQRNTLYRFPAKYIVEMATIKVSVFYTNSNGHSELIETYNQPLINKVGNGLEYNVEIVNGTQTYLYSVGGVAPTKPNGESGGAITIKPLTFRVIAQDGALVYDSDTQDYERIITLTNPRWRYYRTNSLITTQYSPDLNDNYEVDTDDITRGIVKNTERFKYGIADNFNIDYRDRSNIELQVTIDGADYFASTNFTFAKQGDLGTNGTNYYLDIEDPSYEQYKSDVLTIDKYSRFKKSSGTDGYANILYSPYERHLSNTYMYATRTYTHTNDVLTEVMDFKDGNLVNLRFANSVGSDTDKVTGSTSATLYGYWWEDGVKEMVDGDSEWSAPVGEFKYLGQKYDPNREKVYDRASFQVTTNGSSTLATLIPITDIEQPAGNPVFYKPMDNTYSSGAEEYSWTASNIVRCATSREVVGQVDPDTKQNIMRRCYGYYQIPFFYYAHYTKINGVYINDTPEGLDPSKHFAITGGFDQIIYDVDGFNPQYSKQPFEVHLKNLAGEDISDTAFSDNNKFIIEWDSSYGFVRESVTQGDIPNYSTYSAGTSLLGKYCTYGGKVYKCVVDHTPDQKVTIRVNDDSTVVKSYNVNTVAPNYDFITPYWEQVDVTYSSRSRKITPLNSYEAMVANNLFNSWVSVKVKYINGNEKFEGAALLPINILCNAYGSEELNNWDGKKTQVEGGYIISSKVAAGIKNSQNEFIGITLGRKMYEDQDTEDEVGLFGYGRYQDDTSNTGSGYGQTLFLDAKTGLAAFGPRGATQIILNPRVPDPNTRTESWSRLGGWYISPNYLYKPLYEDNISDSDVVDSRYNVNPPDADGKTIPGSVGLYVPSNSNTKIDENTVFLWASAAGISSMTGYETTVSSMESTLSSIRAYFYNSEQYPDFPFYYTQITPFYDTVRPTLLYNTIIENHNQIVEYYGTGFDLDPEYVDALNDYDTLLRAYMDFLWEELPTETLNLQNAVDAIGATFSTSGFPTRYWNGRAITPILQSPDLTIQNLNELKFFYCNNNDKEVTNKTNLISQLTTQIADYETAYQHCIDGGDCPERDELAHCAQAIAQWDNMYDKTGPRPVWNTASEIAPAIVGYDIENLGVLRQCYARPAYTATEIQKQYLTNLNTLFNTYETLSTSLNGWNERIKNTGRSVGYSDDKRKANFYVTYGGKMHCEDADIQGTIKAASGYIGVDDHNAISICTTRQQDNQFYLLYNDKFWVRGGANPTVHVEGSIVATSGQIGTGSNEDQGGTLWIEHNWYPRVLPDEYRRWSDIGDITVDKTAGKIIKYALWSPHFSVVDSVQSGSSATEQPGDTCILGDIYATGGRIGDLVIYENPNNHKFVLKDPFDTIRIKPQVEGVQGGEHYGWINCGRVTIFGDGAIKAIIPDGPMLPDTCPDEVPGTLLWDITSDGVAHFNDWNSTFNGQTFQCGGSNSQTRSGTRDASSGTTILNANGLTITNGNISLNGGTISTANSLFTFSHGASFNGPVSTNSSYTITDSQGHSMNLDGDGLGLFSNSYYIGTHQGAVHAYLPPITIAPHGAGTASINCGFGDINSVNRISCSELNVTSLYIGGEPWETYIAQIAKAAIGTWVSRIDTTPIDSGLGAAVKDIYYGF